MCYNVSNSCGFQRVPNLESKKEEIYSSQTADKLYIKQIEYCRVGFNPPIKSICYGYMVGQDPPYKLLCQ